MIIYFVLFFLLLIGAVIYSNNNIREKKSNYLLIFTTIILILFSGLRANTIGNDTIKYIELYKLIPKYNISFFANRYEIGFIYLNKILGYISTNAQMIIFASSVIIWTLLILFLKKNSINPLISIYILLSFGFVSFFMSGIRESIAIAICLSGVEMIKHKKPIFFCTIVFIATLFHTSALLFLAAYPIYHLTMNKKAKIIIIFFSIISMLYLNPIIKNIISYFPKYSYYLNSEYNNGEIRLASILNLFVIIAVYYLSVLYTKNNLEDYKKNKGYLNMVFVGAMILLISIKFNLLDRVANYYTIFISIVIPNILFKNKTPSNKIITIIILSCFFIYFMCTQLIRPEWNSIYPYHFFWQ